MSANTPRHVVLAGGSGFLGSLLAGSFVEQGHRVVILTRDPRPDVERVRYVQWDGESLGSWAKELENAFALINLAGRSVDCRYNQRNRRRILESRIKSTRVLGEALARCSTPPPVWLNSSTATLYRHTFGPAWDESGDIGGTPEAMDEFSVEVARQWERALSAAPTPRTRKVALRSAMVLGTGRNSVFPVLQRLVRFGLGGALGGGRQFLSWIHQADFCGAVEWLTQHAELEGPVNLASPNPVTNQEFMRTLRAVCGIPLGLPARRWMLEIGAFFLRTETELVIKSRRVVPGRLTASGFRFTFPLLRTALEDLTARTA